MINTKLVLDLRRAKKDGSYPIIFRIYYNSKSTHISTGISCNTKDWNEINSLLFEHSETNLLLNKRLITLNLAYKKKIVDFELEHLSHSYTVSDIKSYLTSKNKAKIITASSFWMDEINRNYSSKNYSNARNLNDAHKGLSKYKSLNIPFEKIDFKWLTELEIKMKANNVKTNTIGVYLRTLRSIYNKAINYGFADLSNYPFRRFKIKHQATPPRSITIDEMKSFFHLELNPIGINWTHWNIGKLLFMLRGINFKDLALLTHKNIKNGRIVYSRSKTGKIYSIKITPEINSILKLFHSNDRLTLVPIFNNDEFNNPEIHPKRIAQLRKTTNKYLNRMGKQLGIKESLSTYVFRYSHANICKSLGYSKDLISESLGHGYGLSVSSAYLEDYNIELIDEMNEEVINAVK